MSWYCYILPAFLFARTKSYYYKNINALLILNIVNGFEVPKAGILQ
jgi:hypothetical protein